MKYKFLNKRNLKKMVMGTVEHEIKLLIGAISTILIHRVIQYLANRYPKLNFLKLAEDRTTHPV